MSTLRSGIDRFETDVAEYEARGQPKPSDESLRAALLQLVPENLEEHLELNIQNFDTYSKMRAEVISFLEQKVSKSLIDDGGARQWSWIMLVVRVKVRKVKAKVAV